MTKRRGKPFSRKVKRRKPIREAFYNEFVKGKESIRAVRFSHKDGQDVLIVTVKPTHAGNLPIIYEGYPINVQIEKRE